ncbi:MAG: hypothetical protein ACRERV_11615 [Methylococcales bacterium]
MRKINASLAPKRAEIYIKLGLSKMKAIFPKQARWGRLGRLIAAAVSCLVAAYAPATLAANPTIFMQSATLNGASDSLTVTRIPVQDAAGNITYKNVAMKFNVDAQGRLSLRPGSFTITAAPNLLVGQFKPGVYQGSEHGYNNDTHCNAASEGDSVKYDVGSPGVLPGGRAAASMNSRPAYCADGFNAAWFCGPIAGHPNEAALRSAGITSTSLCWGSVQVTNNDKSNYDTYPGWQTGDIIGAVQIGNQISIHNFGNDNIENGVLVFTLCPTCR